jgi:hypothetical protein
MGIGKVFLPILVHKISYRDYLEQDENADHKYDFSCQFLDKEHFRIFLKYAELSLHALYQSLPVHACHMP